MKNGKLIHTIKQGYVRIYIWENETTRDGQLVKFYSFSVTRIYVAHEKVNHVNHFRACDLNNLEKAALDAQYFLDRQKNPAQ